MTLVGHDPICHNYSDGAITISTSGGNGTLTFTITDSTGTIINSRPGGTENALLGRFWYYVEVTDDSACYLIDSVYLVNPPPISAQISFINPTSLGACDGIASVDTIINNQGNYYNIAFFWSPGGPRGIGENIKDDLCNDFYELTIIDDYGCDYYEEIVSGSASHSFKSNSFNIYPNPTNGKLNIDSNGTQIKKTEVYAINGQLLLELVSTEQVDLSTLEKGHYLLIIETNETRTIHKINKE
jgi:hypothetical protein